VRALAGSQAGALAKAAWRLLTTDGALRQQIISVGLPIVAPEGKNVYRGSTVVVPPEAGRDPLSVAPRVGSICVRSSSGCGSGGPAA